MRKVQAAGESATRWIVVARDDTRLLTPVLSLVPSLILHHTPFFSLWCCTVPGTPRRQLGGRRRVATCARKPASKTQSREQDSVQGFVGRHVGHGSKNMGNSDPEGAGGHLKSAVSVEARRNSGVRPKWKSAEVETLLCGICAVAGPTADHCSRIRVTPARK